MRAFRRKGTDHTLTDVLITHSLIDHVEGRLYSYRYENEKSYRTLTEDKFKTVFEEGVITTDGKFIEQNTPFYIVSLYIESHVKNINVLVNKYYLGSNYNDGNVFSNKEDAIHFFDDVIAKFEGFSVTIVDVGG